MHAAARRPDEWIAALSVPGCDGGFNASTPDDAYLVTMLAPRATKYGERIQLPPRPDGPGTHIGARDLLAGDEDFNATRRHLRRMKRREFAPVSYTHLTLPTILLV
eukprot:1530414-Pyramimonas_sp.AAC.2